MTPPQAIKFLDFVLAAYKNDGEIWINSSPFLFDGDPSQVEDPRSPRVATVSLRDGGPLCILFVTVGRVQTAFSLSRAA